MEKDQKSEITDSEFFMVNEVYTLATLTQKASWATCIDVGRTQLTFMVTARPRTPNNQRSFAYKAGAVLTESLHDTILGKKCKGGLKEWLSSFLSP